MKLGGMTLLLVSMIGPAVMAQSGIAGNKVSIIMEAPASLAISGSRSGAGVGASSPSANFSF